jgi:hypothetical protein
VSSGHGAPIRRAPVPPLRLRRGPDPCPGAWYRWRVWPCLSALWLAWFRPRRAVAVVGAVPSARAARQRERRRGGRVTLSSVESAPPSGCGSSIGLPPKLLCRAAAGGLLYSSWPPAGEVRRMSSYSRRRRRSA